MNKKIILTMILVITVLAFSSFTFAASKFTDVNGTKYDAAVEKLNRLKIVDGFEDGTYKPNEGVTRAQMAKLLVEGLGLKKANDIALFQFSDVNNTNWFYSYVKVAYDNKVIDGYPDGTFKPNNNVTFAEAMAMIIRAMGREAQMKDKTWPTGYMNFAASISLLNNVTYASPNDFASRGESAVALYNMVNKIETEKQEAELAKIEADRKAIAEAKKNAFEFGIVTESSYSKDTYYVKLDGNKSKDEVYSIKGSKKLTESKIEAVMNSVIAYRDSDNGLEIETYYTASSLDKAKIISSISNNVITFKDKDKWDVSSTSVKDAFKLYTFVRLTCSYDDDGVITFEKCSNLGLGIDSVTFGKTERVLVDETNKVCLVLKGFDTSDTIKKGIVNFDEDDVDTSGYNYGFVTKTGTRSKVDYAKIDKIEYDIASSSKDFEEDTYAVFTESNSEIKLVKSYGVSNLDSSAEIVNSTSGKSGAQTIKYKGSSNTVDFYTTANTKKYKSYQIIVIEVAVNSKNVLEVDNHYTADSLEDITFSKGDRIIIDTKTKVFALFTGLEANDVVKSGKWTSAKQAEEEENKTFKIYYAWASGKAVSDASLPSTDTAKNNTKYYVKFPTSAKYTYTSSKGNSFTVTGDTTVYITPTAKKQYIVTYRLKDGLKTGVVTLPATDTVYDGQSYTIKVPSASGYNVTVSPSGTQTIKGNITVTVSYEAKKTYNVKYVLASGSATGIVTLPKGKTVSEGESYTIETISPVSGYTITVNPTGTKTINADLTVTVTVTKNPPTADEAARIKELKEIEIPKLTKSYEAAKKESDAAEKDLNTAKTALSDAEKALNTSKQTQTNAEKDEKAAQSAFETAQTEYANASRAYDKIMEKDDATDEEKKAALAEKDAKSDALDAAEKELNVCKAATSYAKADVAAKQKAKDSAQSAKDSAQSEYDTKLGITNIIKENLDDAKKELAELEK